MIDSFRGVTDDGRRWLLTEEAWRVNPQMIELRRQLAILGPEVFDVPAHTSLIREKGYVGVDDKNHIGVPLLGPAGWFGSIGYALSATPTAAVERELGIVATDLSVWCTQHGVSTLPEVRPLARRQHDAARLAAAGRTNLEIADELALSVNTVKLRAAAALGVRECRIVRRCERGDERRSGVEFPVLGPLGVVATLVCGRTNAAIATALGISINTVKARLKEVFERLRVDNRTELASALRTRLAASGSADRA